MPERNSQYEIIDRESHSCSELLGKRMTGKPSDRPSEEGGLVKSAGQLFWCYA